MRGTNKVTVQRKIEIFYQRLSYHVNYAISSRIKVTHIRNVLINAPREVGAFHVYHDAYQPYMYVRYRSRVTNAIAKNLGGVLCGLMADALQNSDHTLAQRVYALRRYVGTAIKYVPRVTGKPQRRAIILQNGKLRNGRNRAFPRTDLVRAYYLPAIPR